MATRPVSFREILAALDVLSVASAMEVRAACDCADGMDTRRGHISGALAALAAYAVATEAHQARADEDARRAAEAERLAAIQAARG